MKYVVGATAGLEPRVMGLGPIFASRKALQRANLSSQDLGLVELNEAFASQSLECIRQLELDPAKGQCKWWSNCLWTSIRCKWCANFNNLNP